MKQAASTDRHRNRAVGLDATEPLLFALLVTVVVLGVALVLLILAVGLIVGPPMLLGALVVRWVRLWCRRRFPPAA